VWKFRFETKNPQISGENAKFYPKVIHNTNNFVVDNKQQRAKKKIGK
jgi:hypothetical protein